MEMMRNNAQAPLARRRGSKVSNNNSPFSRRTSPYGANPKSNQAPETRTIAGTEDSLVRGIDTLAIVEQYYGSLIPQLKNLVDRRASSKEIFEASRAVVAAKLASIAVGSADERTSLAAISELLNRLEGKAKESKEITHKMASLKDEELDAVLLTALQESAGDDEVGKD
jgi:hypothetical protein